MGRTSWVRPYFLDASVIVKLVLDEEGSIAVRSFCNRPEIFRTTWLSLAETYGVVKRRWRKEKWEAKRYCRKIYSFQRYVQKRIKLDGAIELSAPDMSEIDRIHTQYALDFSDALHIVLLHSDFYAHLAGESKPVLVACDKKLLRAAHKEGIITWNPEREGSPPGIRSET